MASFEHKRDGVLTPFERLESALKCLEIIGDPKKHNLKPGDSKFVEDQIRLSQQQEGPYSISEKQLQWLRDIKDRRL